jgi:FAD dependent oxidoreductase
MAASIDTLSLIALKCGPNVFDLSSGLVHVSMRDQIVRAQLLIRDLIAADTDITRLLIVGAGIAGISAATAASAAGKSVTVVDTQHEPMSLQRGVASRHVGPFMYEWPTSIHNDQTYPPTARFSPHTSWPPAAQAHTPQWRSSVPLSANDFAANIDGWLRSYIGSVTKPPAFLMDVDGVAVKTFVKSFARAAAVSSVRRMLGMPWSRPPGLVLNNHYDWRTRTWESGPRVVSADYVILAAGMGAENTELYKGSGLFGVPFWGNDTLLDPATTDQAVGVFGGGDGALQDVLRVLTGFNHPIDLMKMLNTSPDFRDAVEYYRDELQVIEQQSRLYSTWTQGGGTSAYVDEKCREIARAVAAWTGVASLVMSAIRDGSGTVHHFVREAHFGKAYLLNRFAVYLIQACRESGNWNRHSVQYALQFKSHATGCTSAAYSRRYAVDVEDNTGPYPRTAPVNLDVLVVRYGIVPGSVPAQQMIQLSAKDSGRRTTFGHVPLPFAT